MVVQLRMSLALSGLFAGLIVATKFLPTPIDKASIGVQALLLTLSALSLPRLGGLWVGLLGGLLTALLRPGFAPLTVGLAALYGFLIDTTIYLLKARRDGRVSGRRLIAAVTAATAIIGVISYYITVHLLALLPRNPLLEVAILAAGIVNGLIGGLLATLVWRRLGRALEG
jgi:uncharacterized membrane protein